MAAGDVFGGEAMTTLAVEERAYWILAAVAGLAAIVALGQILVRSLRLSGGDVDALGALGCSIRQRMVMLMAAPMARCRSGVARAFALAYAASALVPTGLASRIDPEPGVWVDMRFAIAVAAVLAAALTLTLIVTAQRAANRRAVAAYDIAPPSRLTSASHSAPSLLGLRAALGGPDTATRRSARAATAIVVAALATVVAVPVWTASLHSLRTTPRAHGWDFDAAVEQVGAPIEEAAATDALAAKLDASAVTSAIERVDIATVSVAGESVEVELMIMQARKGSLHPTLRQGRAPARPEEVAVSTQGLKALHTKIGDTISLDTPTGSPRAHRRR